MPYPPHLIQTTVVGSYPHFFFNDTATTEIYTLSLHDALPILHQSVLELRPIRTAVGANCARWRDRKSTRLNSSHQIISYAVFCLKKKKTPILETPPPENPRHTDVCAPPPPPAPPAHSLSPVLS